MHIILTQRAAMPGGGIGNAGQVFDLPPAEAKPLLKSGAAIEGTVLPAPVEPAEPPAA